MNEASTTSIPVGDISIEINDRPLSAILMEAEKTYLAYALTRAGGNKAKAARIAGVADDTFRKKVGRYQVKAIYVLD